MAVELCRGDGEVAETRSGIRVALIVVVEGRLHHCCLKCRSQRGSCQGRGRRRHAKLFDRKCSRISERGWDPHRCVGRLRPPIIKKVVDRLDDSCSLHRPDCTTYLWYMVRLRECIASERIPSRLG